MDIGIKLRKLRESQKLSQPELADRLAIGQTTLCNIESGITKKIDFALMDKIVKSLIKRIPRSSASGFRCYICIYE